MKDALAARQPCHFRQRRILQRHVPLRALPQYCLLLFLFLLPSASSQATAAPAPAAARESAVMQARSGDAKGALAKLKELVKSYPDDPRLLADATIVANWAGDDPYALDIYAKAQTPKNDAGVVEAAARSARNLHHYAVALDLFRDAANLARDRWQPRLGYAMVLTDEGHYDEAAEWMKPLVLTQGSEPDVERGEAYLCARQRDFACAIRMYQQLIQQIPGDRDRLQCQLAQQISELGGNTLARGMCDSARGTEKLQLVADQAAERVRWSDSVDHDWQARNADAEEALTLLDGVIAASHPSDLVWRQAQWDRLLALYNLYRMQDVVDSWEHLRSLNVEVPDYALAKVANAYLTLRHPREAERLYRSLVERSPDDGELWSGLTYAEFESEHISEAFQTIDKAYGNSPAWLQSPGLKVPQPNDSHASLGIQAAAMRRYADMPHQAQTRLAGLMGLAPADPELGRAMAMTYLARGWPLKAIRQERIADSFELKDELPVLQDAEILEGAGRHEEADALMAPLLKREGNSPALNRFLSERAVKRGWQASVDSGYEWSNGRYLGNAEHSEAYLYSPFIHDRWRAYLHAIGDSGQFTAGSAYRSRSAMGIRYAYNRQSFWGEAGADSGSAGLIPAGTAGTEFNLGDQWILGVEGDSDNLTDVQLIAQLAGIRARSVSVHAAWRKSELTSVRGTLERLLYSDGNQRSVISGTLGQRIWTAPRLQVDLSPQAWASANSKDQNRAYFNPKHDLSLGPAATVSWITWRRYDRSLLQSFAVYAAPYWQQNYGVKAAVSAGLTEHWKLSKRLGLVGNLVWNGQPYDGTREPYTNLSFGLIWGNQ